VRFDKLGPAVAEDALCGILYNVVLCRLDPCGGKVTVRQVKLQSFTQENTSIKRIIQRAPVNETRRPKRVPASPRSPFCHVASLSLEEFVLGHGNAVSG
jgi:hypothetical protein